MGDVTREATVGATARDTVAGGDAETFAGTAPRSSGRDRPSSSSGWLSGADAISHGRFPPGAVLDGRYRIIGLLGRGGMGEVYRADDLRLGQPVALKFLPDAVASDPVRLAQFHNEVRTARQIAHPNICRVYDIGEAEGHLFLSMEYIDGEDLATSLRRIGRFAEDKATDIARQLCAGLAAAHQRGVIHRDLKPANVMLDDAGTVRLMDFGLAAIGMVEDIRVGTPSYMAPEQLLGREVTAHSDIYALGLVLYELYTGRRAFTASTLNDLVEQHQSGSLTPPSALVSQLDPAIERAIMRCLDPDPAKRPASAIAVSAALPGGDPLAAALAAGETPSPEMVAAAGAGAHLTLTAAGPVFAAVLIGIVASYALGVRMDLLDALRPELTGEVLAQRARDAIRTIGYTNRPADEAYWFSWDGAVIQHTSRSAGGWRTGLSPRRSPLSFSYRRSDTPMIGLMFHHDLLTPGIVTRDDPPPIEPGMVHVTLDHQGYLLAFEAIPPQVEEAPPSTPPVDWTALLTLAGLDAAALQPAEAQWQWLAAADTRVAWTGTWPDTTDSIRVEAASLRGRPVAFQVIGPWTRPWRTPTDDDDGGTTIVVISALMVLTTLVGALLLARRNLAAGRGDHASALKMASAITLMLSALWLCQAHFAITPGILAIFLLAVVTTTSYGLVFWTIYLAAEPMVRRYWPQTLVSWTTLLRRTHDPIVGRDVLFGVALGVAVSLLVRFMMEYTGQPNWPAAEFLLGTRSSVGETLSIALYAVRSALLVFFLLFLLRVVFRNQWAAALTLALLFAVLDAADSEWPLVEGSTQFLYFAMFAVTIVRWGFTSLVIGLMVADLLLNVPATSNPAAWYVGPTAFVLAIPLALAAWGFRTATRGNG